MKLPRAWPNDFFLGDYFGLAPVGGGGFVAAFSAVDRNNHTSIFVRRIGL
jgi:hypothetical protein